MNAATLTAFFAEPAVRLETQAKSIFDPTTFASLREAEHQEIGRRLGILADYTCPGCHVSHWPTGASLFVHMGGCDAYRELIRQTPIS